MRFFILSVLALCAVPVFGQAPSIPASVTAVATSGTTVTVTWAASTFTPPITPSPTISYLVTRTGGGPNFISNPISGTTFSDTGLAAGITYSYSVRAFNGVEGSAASSAASVTTPTVVGAPTGLRGSVTTEGIVLSWTAVGGATGYVIFRNGTEIDTSTTNSYSDTEVEGSTTYRYSVASTNAAGDSDESAEIAVTTRGDGSQRTAVWTREFERADGDFDGIVFFDEYLAAFPNTLPWVVMRHRFLGTDDDDTDDLTVDEYIEHFAGKTIKRPSKQQAFFLADSQSDEGDGDGDLSVEEYAYTLNRGTKESVVMKKFDKLDKNGTGYLSEIEFGIRYGSPESGTGIESPLTASATLGVAFTYQIEATKSPISYGATGLPAGLVVDTTTGLISGTPTVAGVFNVAISATGTRGTANATLVLTVSSPPVISSSLTASGTTGIDFNYQIVATPAPTSYGATGLPAGLAISTSTGVISGTPTVAATTNVTITATNATGTDTETLVITISPAP